MLMVNFNIHNNIFVQYITSNILILSFLSLSISSCLAASFFSRYVGAFAAWRESPDLIRPTRNDVLLAPAAMEIWLRFL